MENVLTRSLGRQKLPGKGSDGGSTEIKIDPKLQELPQPHPLRRGCKGQGWSQGGGNALEQVRDTLEWDEEQCQGWASHIPPREKFSSRVRGKSDWKLLKVSSGLQIIQWGRKNRHGTYGAGGRNSDATSFPRLRHACAKIHPEKAPVNALPDALHGKSQFCAGRGLLSIQKLCCSRGGRRKKAVWGGELSLGIFKLLVRSPFSFSSRSEAA